ncbi:MAG: hypothetical protein AMJ53_03975 [Gammaproteobacteria bacterium SG8_11]|nr:MAG: hypothetical protein AMJ53_03975 [Gammaproteobacteria bacterium SG8_11]
MTAAEPLFLVLTFLTLLWFVGAWLSKINALPPDNSRINSYGTEILSYLHVSGLKEYQCSELKAIVSHNDELALHKFIAYYRPGIIELDKYIDALRRRFLENLGKTVTTATDIEKIAAANRILLNDQPQPYDFSILSKSEIRILLEFGAGKGQAVNDEFVEKFGDAQFLENFNAYKQLLRGHNRTLYIPKKDPNRNLVDLLAEHGVIKRGRKIELQDRLRILPLKQLNDMARELKIRKTFQSHEHAVQTLATVPGSAILLAMSYAIDDLFYLDPNALDVEAIERDLAIWSAYAKLITWPGKQAAPKMALTQSL